MVGGRTLNALTDNVYATASQLVTDAGYAHLNDDPDQAHFCTTSNLALPTEEFRAIGGFDETFVTSEDRELCGRWESAGRRVFYASLLRYPLARPGGGNKVRLAALLLLSQIANAAGFFAPIGRQASPPADPRTGEGWR